MGSLITLGIGTFEIDWAKNNIGTNHSRLFKSSDLSEGYYHYADNYKTLGPAYVRKLGALVRRIELLGYTLAYCEHSYNELYRRSSIDHPEDRITFDVFAKTIKEIHLTEISDPHDSTEDEYGEFIRTAIFGNPQFFKGSEFTHEFIYNNSEILETIEPYIILRLLAENPENLPSEVLWRFHDLLMGGYISEDDIFEELTKSDQILIVTEGSTDSDILRLSAQSVAPDINDFFYFADMAENYPFTGAGSVVRFAQGLSRIGIINRVLVILDNDTEGNAARMKIEKLNLPTNIGCMTLPTLPWCNEIQTEGPSGASIENINGRAVSIEAFLDSSSNPSIIRWSSYNEALGDYQGALINKEAFVTHFHNHRSSKEYDFSKLTLLWNEIFQKCLSLKKI